MFRAPTTPLPFSCTSRRPFLPLIDWRDERLPLVLWFATWDLGWSVLVWLLFASSAEWSACVRTGRSASFQLCRYSREPTPRDTKWQKSTAWPSLTVNHQSCFPCAGLGVDRRLCTAQLLLVNRRLASSRHTQECHRTKRRVTPGCRVKPRTRAATVFLSWCRPGPSLKLLESGRNLRCCS